MVKFRNKEGKNELKLKAKCTFGALILWVKWGPGDDQFYYKELQNLRSQVLQRNKKGGTEKKEKKVALRALASQNKNIDISRLFYEYKIGFLWQYGFRR